MAHVAAGPVLQYGLCYHTACVTGWPALPYGQHYCVAITDTFVHTTQYICHTVLTYSIYSIWGVDGWPIYHSLLCRYPSLSIHISLKAANISAGKYTYTDDLLKLDECTDGDHHMQWTTCPSPIHISKWVEPLLSHSDHKFAAYMYSGLKTGFHIGFSRQGTTLQSASKKHPSAAANISAVREYIRTETEVGRLVGLTPFYSAYVLSFPLLFWAHARSDEYRRMQFHTTIYLCSSPLPPRLGSSPSSPRCHSYWYTLGRTGGQHPRFNCLLAHWSRYRGVHTVWFSLSSINALHIYCNMNQWTLTEILLTQSSALFRFIAWVIFVTASTKLTKFQ